VHQEVFWWVLVKIIFTVLVSLLLTSNAFADCGFEKSIVTGDEIPLKAKNELQQLLKASCNPSAKITSTIRTSKRQTELMLIIYNRDGLEAAKFRYSNIGDKVFDYFDTHKNKGKAFQLKGGQKIIDDFVLSLCM